MVGEQVEIFYCKESSRKKKYEEEKGRNLLLKIRLLLFWLTNFWIDHIIPFVLSIAVLKKIYEEYREFD